MTAATGWLLGCSSGQGASSQVVPIPAEAGFAVLSPRQVSIEGRAVLFNGFASDVVRAFGTGPMTVEPDGSVVTNPASLTRFANLLYIDPRQAGFSYDVIAGRAPTAQDCSQDVFSEYVDAADVLLATLQFLQAHPESFPSLPCEPRSATSPTASA